MSISSYRSSASREQSTRQGSPTCDRAAPFRLSGTLMEDRQVSSGSLDIAALARRRLRALRGVKERELDNPLCIAAADLVIETIASRLVFEAAFAAEGQKLRAGARSGAIRDLLVSEVEDLGDDDVYELLAMALRHSEHPDPVSELREDLAL